MRRFLALLLYRLLGGTKSEYVRELEAIKREQEAGHNRENARAIVEEFRGQCEGHTG